MTLRQKILLLGLVAIAGMFLALWLQYWGYAKQLQAIEVAVQNVKAVGALSLATHEMQKERGLTTIHHSKMEGQILVEQIALTDAALSRLAGTGVHIVGFNESLAQVRKTAAAASTEQLTIRDDYTKLLQSLIDEMDRLTRVSDAVTNADIAALPNLIGAKEYLGQIRATLGYWLAQKNNEIFVLNTLIRLKGLHDEQRRKFELAASPELREIFATKFSGREVERTLSAVTQIVSTGKLPQGLDERVWWAMATSAIDRLKIVEDRSLELIEQKAKNELVQLRNAMNYGVAATLAFGLAVFILAISATTSLLRALGRVLASMEHIAASQNFQSRIPADSPDEIGRISRSFNQLLDIAERLLKEKDYLATTDTLMGINNRLKFAQVLGEEANRKRRTKTPMALAIFDIDHFKRINDTYGHDGGDEVLKALAHLISSKIRATDFFARWGGEEFVLLLRDNNCNAVMAAAEKLRNQIENTVFPAVGKVTCSFGVAAWEQGDTEEGFVARADKALYAAKKGGRNQVICTHGAKGSCRGRFLCAHQIDADPLGTA